MGGLDQFRNHLLYLFARAFSRECHIKKFQRIIVDFMQYIVGTVRYDKEEGNTLQSSKIIRKTQKTLDFYMNEQDYTIEECLIFLLDSPEYVPSLKAATQKSRDSNKTAATTDDNDKCATNPTIFNEEDYNRYMETVDINELDHLIVNESTDVAIDRTKLWRSINLRLQLYRLITHSMIGMQIKEGMVFMLDDGLAISDRTYCDVRSDMINDYGFNARTEYEKECLISSLSRHHMTEKIYVYPDNKIARQASSQIGEADIKICHYITRERSRYLVVSQDTDIIFILLLHMKTLLDPMTHRFADDLEVIIDTRIPKDEKLNKSRPYRFIDVKLLYGSIIDLFERDYPSVKNPIETLVMLAYSLKTDFTVPFHPYLGVSPAVVWNTFSELHNVNRAGFIVFHGKCIDPFNEEGDGGGGGGGDEDEENEGDQIDSSSTPSSIIRNPARLLPKKLFGLVSNAVSCSYNVENDAYELDVDELKWEQFYYLLCELKVRKDLAYIGYKDYDSKTANKYILDVDQLFMKVTELEECIELCRKSGFEGIQKKEEDTKKAFLANLEAEKKAISEVKAKADEERKMTYRHRNRGGGGGGVVPPPMKKATQPIIEVKSGEEKERDENKRQEWLAIFDSIGTNNDSSSSSKSHHQQQQQQPSFSLPVTPIIDKTVVTLSKRKKIPPRYGIPEVNKMKARIYRIRWVMNYHQNGWLSTDYSMNFDHGHPQNYNKSHHGWSSREIIQTPETIARGDFNNAYYTSRYSGVGQPVSYAIPFRIFETFETDDVFDRNYNRYFSGQ